MGIDQAANVTPTLNDLCLLLFMTSGFQDLKLAALWLTELAALWLTEREMMKLKIQSCLLKFANKFSCGLVNSRFLIFK